MSKAKPASPPPSLDDASERLSRAFAAMEKAIKHRPVVPAGGDDEAVKSWQVHCANLESDLAAAHEEIERMKQETTKMSNQLIALQHDYVALQKAAVRAADVLDEKAAQLDLIG